VKKVRYMISDAANMMQVESHVLRYWEEELELDVPRNEMGHRYYTEENMQQFRQIKKWKEEGYQLKAIKMMLHNENPNLEEAKQQEHTTAMSGETESEPEKDGQQMHVAVSHTNAAPAGLTKLEQFQLMMNDIVRNAIAENNQALGQAVSEHVGEKVIKEMNYNEKVAKVSIVGAGMLSNPGVAATMFESLSNSNININMISTSEIRITVLIDEKDADRALVAIHDGFGLED
jgi:DNA-binding transcriptional MerR regulator